MITKSNPAGALWLGDGRTRFRLWAPSCEQVRLELEGGPEQDMVRHDEGWFEAIAQALPGAKYRFRVRADLAVPDPAARAQTGGVHGWSVVVDPKAYVWNCPDWRGRPWTQAVIYELHCGVLGGFVGAARELPRLKALGVTAVQLMPVNTVSGTRNWGYDGVLTYAPSAAYGSPEDLKALVDQAHGLGLMVFLDVVYNHFGPEGNYLPFYAPGFFDVDTKTPWGDAIAFHREPVARFFIDNALYWLTQFYFDGLRFDAVHAIGDTVFLDRMAAELRDATPGREIHLILENENNDPARLTSGFNAQWNDDFHNVLHVLLTGETGAYYRDFAEDSTERLARCLAEGFIYQGEGSPNHEGRPRGAPSGHLPPTAFVSFLQNHDQVGNRALGERLTTLVPAQRLAAAMALMLLCPQIPMLFMGEELGSTTPFLFFTDFHDDLAVAVREGRRREFAKFPAFADPDARAKIPDPNAQATFEASRPQPGPDAAAWTELIRRLLEVRRRKIVPGLAECLASGASALGPAAVQARWRLGGGQTLNLAVNLGDAAVVLAAPTGTELFRLGQPQAGALPAAGFVAWLEPGP